MGVHGGRDKLPRHGRKPRPSAKPPLRPAPAPAVDADKPSADASMPTPIAPRSHPSPPCSGPPPTPGGGFLDGDDAQSAPPPPSGWGYCTEEQLEELLLRNLDLVYREALTKLVALGYDDDLALRAVLRNGHCYGSMDALSNILHNALAHINTSAAADPPASDGAAAFSDLHHLVEYSLAGMVCLLQQVKPHLSRGDAMWCLLMSDLHVGRASTIDLPVAPPTAFAAPCGGGGGGDDFASDGGGGCEIEAECARRFGLSPSMESLLKRNVALFAAGYRARAKPPPLVPAVPGPHRGSFSLKQIYEEGVCGGAPTTDSGDSDVVSSVLSDLEKLSLEEEKAPDGALEDQKKEMIMDLIREIRDLETQVKERMEWAHQKALQAARKLSIDLTELRTLRMEREETLKVKNARQEVDEALIKRLEEMEDALRKASMEVDRANEVVHRLEVENKELKAEMVASKLSASESALMSMEVAKREKKCMKRLAAWEKQKADMQESIAEEKKKIEQMQQQLNEITRAQKEMEEKWRQEIKAKEQAIVLVEEERRDKESADADIRRKHDALHRKIEIDFQRHKDDIKRLEDELSRLKTSAESGPVSSPSRNALCSGDTDGAKTCKDVNRRTPRVPEKSQEEESKKEATDHRVCLFCRKDEVSVVFLPCAHQVLCAGCNEDHEMRAKNSCPCCSFRIEHRIRVFGASA